MILDDDNIPTTSDEVNLSFWGCGFIVLLIGGIVLYQTFDYWSSPFILVIPLYFLAKKAIIKQIKG